MRTILAIFLWSLCGTVMAQQAPVADHHQHIFSPKMAALAGVPVVTARDVIGHLDAAGIRRGVLLSFAYSYARPGRGLPDEYERLREENDWNAEQAAQYPTRLVAFCGFNPLSSYALDELARCAADPRLRRGIKLHIGNSYVQFDDPAHVEQLVRVFRAANERRMAIVIHMRASISKKRPYGAAQARVFLERLLPAAPDVVVQVAHMAGSGPGYDDPPSQEVFETLAAAVEKKDPRTRNLWFDVASVADRNISAANAALLARHIRRVGVDRILYGTDAAIGENLRPRESWAAFLKLPLTTQEFERIAANVAPYIRD